MSLFFFFFFFQVVFRNILMNKNGQHSYQFLMIFHFGITIIIGHGLKKWLATLWSKKYG